MHAVTPPLPITRSSPNPADLHRSKILILDDEPTNVLLLERTLGKAGFTEIQGMTDSRLLEGAMASFAPDLLMLDLHMPPPDGFTLLHQTRERTPPGSFFPVLVLTADATPRSRLRALSEGATDFLLKPFDRSEVVLRVNNLLQTRLLHRQIEAHRQNLEEVVQQRTADLQTAMGRLEATQRQVIQHERLKAFEIMAGGVAHDFNNLLTIITGNGEILRMEGKTAGTSPDCMESLDQILTAARDGAEMVRRLQEYSRPQARSAKAGLVIDVNEIVRQAVDLTRARWKGRASTIRVTAETKPVPPVIGNASELRELLTNLIFNAVDAMPDGGNITVFTEATADEAIVAVVDDGSGMSPEVLRRCLEPFYTTKESRGTGLGLAMVAAIVDRHGGTLDVQSEPGKGTCISIHLPASHRRTDSGTAGAAPEAWRILVVDDQEFFREALAESFRSGPHTVEVAASGRQALEMVASQAVPFDVALVDYAMPEMDGHQLAAALREVSPRTRIVLVTGFTQVREGVTRESPFVHRVLAKPFSTMELQRCVAGVIADGNKSPAA